MVRSKIVYLSVSGLPLRVMRDSTKLIYFIIIINFYFTFYTHAQSLRRHFTKP